MDHAALNKHLSTNAGAVTAILDELLCETDEGQKCLMQAMRYATLGGGKRIRPFLVCASAKLFGIEEKRSLRVAAAIEMVHCYSLVHDDLPAMDDDDLRHSCAFQLRQTRRQVTHRSCFAHLKLVDLARR